VQIQEGKVISVGPGLKTKEGKVVPVSLKVGDAVLLPSYGGTEVKVDEKEYVIYNEDEILAKVQ
jgi:chaperonin GroES